MNWIEDYQLEVTITIGHKTKIYLGRVNKFPGVTSYAKTTNKLLKNLNHCLDAYFDAWPDEQDKLTK